MSSVIADFVCPDIIVMVGWALKFHYLSIADFEKRSLRSAAAVQSELGSPAIIHPGRNPKAPFEIMRIFLEAGAQADKTVMSHLDSKYLPDFPEWPQVKRLAAVGVGSQRLILTPHANNLSWRFLNWLVLSALSSIL